MQKPSLDDKNTRANHLANFYQASNIFIIQVTNVLASSIHIPADSEDYEKNTDSSLQTDKEIGIGAGVFLSLVIAVIWSSKKGASIEDANEIRQQVNPWYRRFKTANGLGSNVGQLIAEFIVAIPFVPSWFKKPLKAIFGGVIGFGFGVFAAIFLEDNPNEYHIKLQQNRPKDSEMLPDTLYAYLAGEQVCYCIKNQDSHVEAQTIQANDTHQSEQINSLRNKIKKAIQSNKDKLPYKDQGELYRFAKSNQHTSFYKKSIFYLGRDGWSKYAKAGLPLGSAIGSAIGAIIGFFLPIPGGLAAGIAIGGAIGAIIGFGAFASIVPLINKMNHADKSDNKADADSKSEEKNKIPYRTNYIRLGTTLGTFMGTIIGFVIGVCLPIPGAAVFCATLGAGIGASVAAIGLGIAGPYITRKLGDKNYSSWDYGARNMPFLVGNNGLGGIINGIFKALGIGSQFKVLKDVVNYSLGLIGAAIGGIYDGYCTISNKENEDWGKQEINESAPILPWSQRLPTFAVFGGSIGGFVGFIIGTLIAGPVGAAIGIAIGSGIGGSVATIVGAIWGNQLYERFHIFIDNQHEQAKKNFDDNSDNKEFKTFESSSTKNIQNTLDVMPQNENLVVLTTKESRLSKDKKICVSTPAPENPYIHPLPTVPTYA